MTEALSTDTTLDTTINEQTGQVADIDNTQTQENNLEENNTSDLTTETKEPADNDNATDTQTTTPVATTTEPSVEQLQSRLKEYELRDEETLRIRERLNLPNSDPQLLRYDTIEAQIDNQSQREWIALCNKYGVDYTPQGIDKSSQDLEAKDPKSYYQFKAEVDRLANDINYRKSAITGEKKNYEITAFYNQNKAILDGSPLVKQLVSNYVQQNFQQMKNPQAELNGLMDSIRLILTEGVEIGKAVSQVEKAKTDKSGVNANSSIATANTTTYDMGNNTKWTRSKIGNLSTSEFEKYEKDIMKAMANGEIDE